MQSNQATKVQNQSMYYDLNKVHSRSLLRYDCARSFKSMMVVRGIKAMLVPGGHSSRACIPSSPWY